MMKEFITREEMEANRVSLDVKLAALANKAVRHWKEGMTIGELADILQCNVGELAHAWVRHISLSTDNVASFHN